MNDSDGNLTDGKLKKYVIIFSIQSRTILV